ncbi:MAG: CHASE3 domain-containing protein [Saprospiraceae bacterium]
MEIKEVFTTSFFLKSIFVAALFGLIFISGVTYKHTVDLEGSSNLVVRSYKVQIGLEQIISLLKDAEAGRRGFILTRDSSFLFPFFNAKEKIFASFSELKELTFENLKQQVYFDTLFNLVYARFTVMARSLEENNLYPLNASQFNNSMVLAQDEMTLIRWQIDRMIRLESSYLEEQQHRYEQELNFTPFINLLLLFFTLVVFIFSYYKINKDLENQKKVNEELIISNESIKHAEEIGDFSTWQWDLENSKFTFSENQYRLLGCELNAFEPTIENFLEFVHPNDRSYMINVGDQVIAKKKPSTIFFRVLLKENRLRYFKLIGKRLTDIQGKKIIIGITMDITEQKLSSSILEERNRQLELSNKELASFNHIASHDLQEPLRKIQTFISRITEKEMANMSPAGKEYFSKIQTSAKRMRVLIDDLLAFSRMNKIEKVFEDTDLNVLLDNARQELAQAIEEHKALISSDPLPVLSVIPFQIQQLFTNLISNSLKYSKPGVVPIIKIQCEKAAFNLNSNTHPDTHHRYYKISFIDNGLGFDQKYAENIFLLFYRLHQDSEYPGTGIGLSICKKIVENHYGFISASSKVNEGATFNILLPE